MWLREVCVGPGSAWRMNDEKLEKWMRSEQRDEIKASDLQAVRA